MQGEKKFAVLASEVQGTKRENLIVPKVKKRKMPTSSAFY